MKTVPLIISTVLASTTLYSKPISAASFLHNIQINDPIKHAFNIDQPPCMRQPVQFLKLENAEPEEIKSLWINFFKDQFAKDDRTEVLTALQHANTDVQKRWAAVNAVIGNKSPVSDINFSKLLNKSEVESIVMLVKQEKESAENNGKVRIDDLTL